MLAGVLQRVYADGIRSCCGSAARRAELDDSRRVAVENVPWSLADEVELFNTCDIGVYPLTDDEWSKGKCGFKAIEFMACGVPVVAAAVGVNRDDHRRTASTAFWRRPRTSGSTSWRGCWPMPALRARFAAAGRRTVEEALFAARATRRQLAATLRATIARRAAARLDDGRQSVKNFAMTGVAGFVAPRHLKAIQDTGNRLVAAVDPHDAVGVLDRYSFDVRFFTEIERFDRHLEKLRRGPDEPSASTTSASARRTICTTRTSGWRCASAPTRSARSRWSSIRGTSMRCRSSSRRPAGASTPCCSCACIPQLIALRDRLRRRAGRATHDVCLTYITARGRWYDVSWKGSEERSGGIVTNIGIHFFDLLLWLFGAGRRTARCTCASRARIGGVPRARARARALVPLDRHRRPAVHAGARRARPRSARSRSTARRSSSATASPICTPASTKRCWPAAASASTTRGRRSSCRIAIRQTPASARDRRAGIRCSRRGAR